MEDVSKELRKAVDQLNRQFAKAHGSDRVLVRMGEEIPEPRYEPTGILTLDQALGGGLPLGTVIAVHGPQFTGKTALAIQMAANFTQRNEYVLYVCTEMPLPSYLIKSMGVKESHFLVVKPQDYAEQMIDAVESLLWDSDRRQPLGLVKLIIIDSVTNFVGKKEVEKLEKEGAEGNNMMVRAQLVDNFLRRLMGRGLLGDDTIAYLVLQDRANTDQNAKVKQVMSGGFSTKYNPKVIIKLGRGKPLAGDKRYLGHSVKVEIPKNAVMGRPAQCEYTVMYGEGIDDTEMLVDKATEFGYICSKPGKRGVYVLYLPNGDVEFVGKPNIGPTIRTWSEVKNELREVLAAGKPATPPVSSGFIRQQEVLESEEDEE
jgi:recombination protein RecA